MVKSLGRLSGPVLKADERTGLGQHVQAFAGLGRFRIVRGNQLQTDPQLGGARRVPLGLYQGTSDSEWGDSHHWVTII